MTCDVWTNPLGGELRCEVDGEMFGTRASRTLDDFLKASDEWRKAFEAKDWDLMSEPSTPSLKGLLLLGVKRVLQLTVGLLVLIYW